MNKTVTDRRIQNTMGDQSCDIIVRLPPPEHVQNIVALNTTEVIPEYYPLHILNDDIIYLQVDKDTVAHSLNPQFRQENTNISQLLKQIAPASAAATLNSSKKVLGYVDK